ncbi:MAG: beta-N-acetylhexosaminidase [Anaerolineaceae bacterium]|nr:beta-N-acetylhexosaminidase [Anaerolineaceae bacterium]
MCRFYPFRIPFLTIRKGILGCLCLLLVVTTNTAQPDILDSLTLEQQVAQMFIVNLYGGQLTEAGRDFLTQWQPGGVVLIGGNTSTPEQVTQLTNAYQQTITAAGGLPLLVAVDQEGGPITHLRDGFTLFPTPALLTAAGSPELATRVGNAMAAELAAVGVNLDLAPVADLETNPQNPIILRRSFGSDPALVNPVLAGFVSGLQAGGVMGTAKHFPGHGASDTDSHTGLPVVTLSRDELAARELLPFQAAINAGVEAIMVAHIWYPALEPEENLPATLSHNIVTGLLRDDLGYNGLILTDALDMDAIDTVYSYPDAVVRAVEAGVDMVISAHVGLESQAAAIQAVVDAVHAGQIPESRIQESVARILAAKARYGVLDWQPLDENSATERVNAAAHAPLVDELFQQGVTVVYDHSDLVPVTAEQRTAMIYPATRPQIAQECGQYRTDIQWVGVSDYPQDTEIEWAVSAANRSDTVIVFTQNAVDNSQQQALVRALPPAKTVVAALYSIYDWKAFPDVAAYVLTYSPERPAVPAVCAVLFGALPAQGRLPITLSETLPAGIHDE